MQVILTAALKIDAPRLPDVYSDCHRIAWGLLGLKYPFSSSLCATVEQLAFSGQCSISLVMKFRVFSTCMDSGGYRVIRSELASTSNWSVAFRHDWPLWR